MTPAVCARVCTFGMRSCWPISVRRGGWPLAKPHKSHTHPLIRQRDTIQSCGILSNAMSKLKYEKCHAHTITSAHAMRTRLPFERTESETDIP